MKLFYVLALIGAVHCASVDRFLPFFTGDKTAVADTVVANSAGGQVSAAPIVLNQTSGGKKVTLTITKTIEKGTTDGVHHQAAATGHHSAGHATHAHSHDQGQSGQLHVNLQDQTVKIDNSTLQSMIEGLLGGNIQNVKITHPEMMHGKKPVAVIFSSAIHVIDLGTLAPEHPVTPAPPPVAAHPDHHHNHTDVDAHQLLNTTALLDTLMAPLTMFSHHMTPQPAVQTAVPMQTMSMQPIIMMVPSTQTSQPAAPMMIQPDQLQGMLASMMAAKTQMLNSTLALQNLQAQPLAQHTHSGLAGVVQQPALPALPVLPAQPVQQVGGIHKKISKVVSINFEKDARKAPQVPTEEPTTASTASTEIAQEVTTPSA